MNKNSNSKGSTNKFKGRRNNKGSYPKKGSQGAATYDDESKQATNNPDHYTANMKLVEATGRLPFTSPIGGPIKLLNDAIKTLSGWTENTSDTKHGSVQSIPGIMVLETVPSFGVSHDGESNINTASKAYFTTTRSKNGGRTNYDAPDQTTYFVGMSSCYSCLNWIQRIYGTIKAFTPTNKYLARQLVLAMGVDYDDIYPNIVSFWGRINLLVSKIASFAVPANMDYFQHVSSMYLDIYTETDSIRSQLYMYNPYGFYKYNFDESQTPVHDEGYLYLDPINPNANQGHLLTANEIFTYAEDMISRMMDVQDLATMSGDVVRAYGDSIIRLAEIDENYRTQFKYDPFVLHQMKNATIVGYAYNMPDLYQDPTKKFLVFEPMLYKKYSSAPSVSQFLTDFGAATPRVMSIIGPDPDPKTVFEYSRLMVTGTVQQDPDDSLLYYADLDCGADVVYRIHIWNWLYNSDGRPASCDHQFWGGTIISQTSVANVMYMNSVLSPFKWHPMLMMHYHTSNGIDNLQDMFDYDNYAFMSNQQLSEIHRVAMWNMLAEKAVASI